jgi:orotate phosphoribosyltransferase
MQGYQADFIRFAMTRKVLLFGEFTLKSGRISPYFFNAGLFNSGACLAEVGRYYAAAIAASGIEFDMLYGPAYKGIPLVAAVTTQIYNDTGRDLPWCFNRKEAKDHGEAGIFVGTQPAGRVLIVDDVISAGTSSRESVELISAAGAAPVGLAIALDRQERGAGERSAVQEAQDNLGLSIAKIIALDDLLEFLRNEESLETELQAVEKYRERYGV